MSTMPDPRQNWVDDPTLVMRYLDQQLSDDELRQFEALLAADEQRIDELVETALQAALIAQMPDVLSLAAADRTGQPVAGRRNWKLSARRLMRPTILRIALLAAVATFSIYVFSHLHSPDTPPVVAQPPSVQPLPTVARLTRTREAVGAAGEALLRGPLSAEAALKAGEQVRLESGYAELRFRNDAVVVLEGPATLVTESPTSGRLLTGKLTAKVPTAAQGFAIHTPDAKIIDLGTQFGVWVKSEESGVRGPKTKSEIQNPKSTILPPASTEVHVFQGGVAAMKLAAGQAESQPIDLREGQAVLFDARSSEPPRIMAASPQSFVTSLDEAVPFAPGLTLVSVYGGAPQAASLRPLSGDGVPIASFVATTYSGASLAVSADRKSIYTFDSGTRARRCQLLQFENTKPVRARVVALVIPATVGPGHRMGLAVQSDGQVLVGTRNPQDGSGQIRRVDPQQKTHEPGVVLSDLLPGLPTSLAVSQEGEIFAALEGQGVARIDPDSGQMSLLVRGIDARGVVLLPRSGELIVAIETGVQLSEAISSNAPKDALAAKVGVPREIELRRYGRDGRDLGRLTLFAGLNPPEKDIDFYRGPVRLAQVAMESSGSLLVAFSMGGGLWRVDLASGQQTPLECEGDLQGLTVVGD
jgi:hypothetical protein